MATLGNRLPRAAAVPGYGARCVAGAQRASARTRFWGRRDGNGPGLAAFPRECSGGGLTMTDADAADFAVVVYREDNLWEAEVLPVALTADLDGLIHALRQQPSIGGTIGLAAIGDDFFVALRVFGGHVSVFLSDVTAAEEWPLARQVLDYLDIPVPEDEELDQVLPAGDLSIFTDLGLDEMELGALAGDLDLFPDEVLARIAGRLGFASALERALDVALG
jgi:putative tRNA adenosine deaminase-associated protein